MSDTFIRLEFNSLLGGPAHHICMEWNQNTESFRIISLGEEIEAGTWLWEYNTGLGIYY